MASPRPYLKPMTIIGLCFLAPTLTVSASEPPETVIHLDTITVTAAKRDTAAREIPASITVKDGIFLEEHQIRTSGELARMVPNLYFKKAMSGDAFVARGISTIDTALVSPMGLYIDDVPYPLSFMQSRFLFNVERVEVLKGPQSTLYGKNSSAGVINVVLPVPTNEPNAKAFFETGNYQTMSAGVAASGPIFEDRLFWGITATGLDTKGYMENQISGADDIADDRHLMMRGVLRWTPIKELDTSLSLSGTDQDKGISNLRYEDGPWKTKRFKAYSNEKDQAEQNSFNQTLRIIYDFAAMDLTSITAHQRFDREMTLDFDRTPVPLGFSHIDLNQDSWSQEFRLTGATTFSMDWLLGLYAGREELDNDWTLKHINPAMANRRISNSSSDSVALFGQSTLALTPKLNATTGLRLDHYSSSGKQSYSKASGTTNFDRDLSETEWLPMVALSYALNDQLDGYLTYSTGWLAGGYDYYSASTENAFAYAPEFTKNYEAGIKARLFNNCLRADLALFYTDIKDKQVREEVSGAGPGVWRYTNAASAHTKGVELELTALPLPHLELYGGIGYAGTEVDDWTGTASGEAVDYSGKHLPWAPDLTAHAGAIYHWENGIYALADFFWTGKQYFDAANTLEQEGYALVNLKAGYLIGPWDMSIWCRNLADEKYTNKKVQNNMNQTLVEDGEPLTIGLTLNWRM